MAKKKEIEPSIIQESHHEKKERLAMKVINDNSFFNPDDYIFDDKFRPGNTSDFSTVHTIPEMIACLEDNKDIESEGIFLEVNSQGVYRYVRMNSKAKILEAWKNNSRVKKMRECRVHESRLKEQGSAGGGYGTGPGYNAGLVGDDYVPQLGGPFSKQQYLYDYLRTQAYAFQEYHHHPLARAVVHITRDFVLGRGYRIDSEDKKALALWKAFEKANNLQKLMEHIVTEGSVDGETMIWWLPNQDIYVNYQERPGQEPAQGKIPRIRLLDPSTCWEIVTFPEDINRVLFYWMIFPTQYQIRTGSYAGQPVPTAKFIQQQLPADDVMHFKYNCFSNEKRGRPDLFPVLGYLKWVRDCINYKLIALKKQAAWTEDISVEGSQADVDNLTQSLFNLGEFEPAGSRFIHTSKIKREYLANQHGSAGDESTLAQGISMIAAGTQIPVSYFGLEKSAGQTKASAIVGTEPVAKKFERRQLEVQRILQAMWDRFQEKYGVPEAECRISFPEIISQDSSQKLKDIKFAEDCGYISRKTAAPLAAKEMGGLDNYDYEQEKVDIDAEQPGPIDQTLTSPLTAPAAQTASKGGGTSAATPSSSSAVTKSDRSDISKQGVDGTP